MNAKTLGALPKAEIHFIELNVLVVRVMMDRA